MIEKTRYVCEMCDTEYETEEEARRCEEKHIPVKQIVAVNYLSNTPDPVSVEVEMADGRVLKFLEDISEKKAKVIREMGESRG